MVAVRDLAVVSNQLEAAKHLADGEETKELGEQDTAASYLGDRNIADSLGNCRRGSGAGGLQERAGVLDGAQGAVEVALEGGDGAVGKDATNIRSVTSQHTQEYSVNALGNWERGEKQRTEGPSSGRGIPACPSQDRLCCSR